MAKNRKLGRTSDIRKSMLRSLATEVIMYGKLETTETRAKEVRSVVEELITLGKEYIEGYIGGGLPYWQYSSQRVSR